MHAMRSVRSVAELHERSENPHAHQRNDLELALQRQARVDNLQRNTHGLRVAGLTSINPKMGTCGSLPDLKALRGREGLAVWRTSTPWSIDDNLVAPAAWPPATSFSHPT